MSDLPLAALYRRDRYVVLASLGAIIALAWIYLVWMAGAMAGMQMPAMLPTWDAGYFLMMFVMWIVMMVGMMLPSVIHVVLLYARIVYGSRHPSRPMLRTYLFAAGYLVAWTLFSLAATLMQWGLERTAMLSASQMQTLSPYLGAGILAAAGAYQWTSLKDVCLEHCRGPVAFLSRHWRPSPAGALRMGMEHGLYCIGCCWALMALLFVGGVMNLLVVALITLFVLFEKLAAGGELAGRLFGGVLIAIALAWMMVTLGQ